MTALATAGAFIGAVSFSGSLIAFGKLQGLIKRSFRFKGQQVVNLVIVAATLALGAYIVIAGHPTHADRGPASSGSRCCSAS